MSKTDLSKLTVDELENLKNEFLKVRNKDIWKIITLIKLKSNTRVKNKSYKFKKTNKLKYKFRPDSSLKSMFLLLEPSLIIEILSELLNIEFNEDLRITPLNTEHYKVLGRLNKNHIRGDLAFKITGINGNEEITIVIELQSTKDDTMGFRMFVYSLNIAEENIINGKKVYEFPKGLTIYTTDDIPNEDGTDDVIFKLDNFSVDGNDYYAEKGNLLTVKFPYKNLFKMDLDVISKSSLYIFSAIYLYKYRKKPELIEGLNITEILDKINTNVKKYKGRNKEVLLKVYSDCYLDFVDVIENDSVKFEKELNQVRTLIKSPTDVIIEKVKREVRRETYEKEFSRVLKMIEKNYDDVEILDLTDFTIDQISKIREEYKK